MINLGKNIPILVTTVSRQALDTLEVFILFPAGFYLQLSKATQINEMIGFLSLICQLLFLLFAKAIILQKKFFFFICNMQEKNSQ